MPSQRKYAVAALFALCVCVLALYIHRHREGQTGKIDNLLIGGAGVLQKQLFYFTRGIRAIGDHYVFLRNVQQDKEELEKELAYLKTKLVALKEVELENRRLRDSLEFRQRVDQPLLAAHVVAHDVSSDYFGIRVDRGESDGVRVGMGVISPDGLVGRVLRTAAHHSDVLALVDPTSRIDSVIQRSRARGIITGQTKKLTCRLKYLDKLEDVAVNDTVVSSGFGKIFPRGLLVGYVTAVIPDANGILQNVVVKPAVEIYRLEEVFIVVSPAEPKEASEQS